VISHGPKFREPQHINWKWVVLKRRVGAVTSQRALEVLFYVNILQCFFVVENFTANAVSVAIGDNGNRLIFEIWWNFFYDLFIFLMSYFLIYKNLLEFNTFVQSYFHCL
jgi:hypothetical protein